MGWWTESEWAAMRTGRDCPMCVDAHLPDNPHSTLITTTRTSFVRLAINQSKPGYCIVVLRQHICELHELGPVELAGFWEDVAAVGRAISSLFTPVKIDNLVMGHRCPHLHCHVYPQYREDDPFGPVDISAGLVRLTAARQDQRASLIRTSLTRSALTG
jgi:diadenosine tetraphosphate (Ap4A) HIT family hydrolase